MPQGFKYACFVSYCHGQHDLVKSFIEQLKTALKSELDALLDEELYIDEERLQPGFRYNEALAQAICQSVCMIVVYSPRYERHEYCMREYEAMVKLEEGRRKLLGPAGRGRGFIIPVILRGGDDVPPAHPAAPALRRLLALHPRHAAAGEQSGLRRGDPQDRPGDLHQLPGVPGRGRQPVRRLRGLLAAAGARRRRLAALRSSTGRRGIPTRRWRPPLRPSQAASSRSTGTRAARGARWPWRTWPACWAEDPRAARAGGRLGPRGPRPAPVLPAAHPHRATRVWTSGSTARRG